ncbi:SAM-dependent methyltransferase [Ottowia testudinis]|uniref:Class I SAM-dependent methyltransferase n=1 Tax=Ottowia testudinis TaxID=2816950 RepID=A0A975CGN2_9BURK|nr:class I SAM-dependent methyltransferase [Ottowia testudinis]QTD45432.1 class I SAM-dependent methyltransferase [Ottowia testudinis]
MSRHGFGPLPARANAAYQTRNVMGRDTLYLNWGLWDAATAGFDAAALNLVRHLGRLAGIDARTRLLDVGFGFGDQLLDWCRHADLHHGVGLNLCPEQTAIASQRLAAAGFAHRVQVRVGDAVALPFDDASFDAVTAVECAFHFRTRPAFFAQAARVLRPGGRLVLADFIGPPASPNRRQRLGQFIAGRFWGFAPGSFCSAGDYRAQLAAAGFNAITLDDVTARVIVPGMRHARRRLWARDLRQRMQTSVWAGSVAAMTLSGLCGDPMPGAYVLVRAVKPE